MRRRPEDDRKYEYDEIPTTDIFQIFRPSEM